MMAQILIEENQTADSINLLRWNILNSCFVTHIKSLSIHGDAIQIGFCAYHLLHVTSYVLDVQFVISFREMLQIIRFYAHAEEKSPNQHA